MAAQSPAPQVSRIAHRDAYGERAHFFYSVRSERLLMEQLDYNLLFRWFVGLNMHDPVWDATVFTKNRQRLLEGDVARAFVERVLAQARQRGVLSDEHFTVDGTLIEAWASLKSFKRKGGPATPPDDPGNPSVDFHGERRSNATHASHGGSAWPTLGG